MSASASSGVDLRPIGINRIVNTGFALPPLTTPGLLTTVIDTSNVKYSRTSPGSLRFKPHVDVSGQTSYITLTIGTEAPVNYTIGRVLGEGSYGTVYEVFDEFFAMTKVRYVLKDQRITRASDRPDYYTEAVMHAILAANSPSVGKIYAIGDASIGPRTSPYKSVMMIMEVAGNTTVQDYLRGLSDDDSTQGILTTVSSIATILDDLQTKCQFTHGDFKSDNCMINTSTKDIKLIDFGFARIIKPAALFTTNTAVYNRVFAKGRDLTTLLFNIRNFIYKTDELEDRLVLEDRVGDLSGCNLNDITIGDDDSSITCNGHTITTDDILGTLYTYFNKHDNIRCWPTTLIAHISRVFPTKPVASHIPALPSSPTSSSHVSPRRGGGCCLLVKKGRQTPFKNRKGKSKRKAAMRARITKKRMRGGRVPLVTPLSMTTPVSMTTVPSFNGKNVQKLTNTMPSRNVQEPMLLEDELEAGPYTMEAVMPVYQKHLEAASSRITPELRNHLTTHAELILQTYLAEPTTSIRKDLLQTLLFFKEYPLGNGAFQRWVRYYTDSSPSKRSALVEKKIHWTAESL
jgi:serine/threonine protein kinase